MSRCEVRFGDERLPERFWGKAIVLPNGCWWWVGATVPDGYGQVRRGRRAVPAHRWAYEALVGPVAPELHCDHLCRFRACVNPRHIEPVTPRENTLRGESLQALNARKQECPSGHPLHGENLYRYPDGRRGCRVCRREQSRSAKLRRRVR